MRMSGNPTQLAQQFEKQASLWEQQSIDYPSTEIIITGDFNFDSNDLFKEYHERTEYANSHNKIYKIVEEKMTKNGFITMNRKTTRGKGLKGKALDHFYTNRPDKMHSIVVHNDTESDHAAVEYNRHMKIEGCEEIYINSRKWENIDYDIINEKIKNDPNYIRALEENNPDNLAEYMIHQINSKLDEQEPLRKINITKIDKQKYSKELVMLIEEKNNLYKKLKI